MLSTTLRVGRLATPSAGLVVLVIVAALSVSSVWAVVPGATARPEAESSRPGSRAACPTPAARLLAPTLRLRVSIAPG